MASTETAPRRKDASRGAVKHLTVDERVARGKAARAKVPRSAHAEFEPAANRADPVWLLERQAESRVPELVPIRYGRMMVSPFAFYRGGALIMAADLARSTDSGIRVQACGDAHLSNFGVFGSAERRLMFDVNDFDETLPAPWEWDVKRLAASLVVAGREKRFARKQRDAVVRADGRRVPDGDAAVRDDAESRGVVRAPGRRGRAREGPIAVPGKAGEADRAECAKARTKDSMHAFSKLTHEVDGEPQIISDPPLIVPVEELFPTVTAEQMARRAAGLHSRLPQVVAVRPPALLEQFRFVHLARKVVGVGSVGTRAWIALFMGLDGQDPLFLQVKEAQPSVLEDFAGKSGYASAGERVVAGQHLMQASSDIFLGWKTLANPIDGVERNFYVRQLKDWKGSADIEGMDPDALTVYGRLCGWTLARAHARSGDRVAIAAYLGGGDAFDRAITEFSEAYADQNDRDYQALVKAVKGGTVEAQTGL